MNTIKDTQQTPWSLEMILKALRIHSWPKHYGMQCTLQTLHIHGKDTRIHFVIYILSSKKIVMMKDANNSSVRSS